MYRLIWYLRQGGFATDRDHTVGFRLLVHPKRYYESSNSTPLWGVKELGT